MVKRKYQRKQDENFVCDSDSGVSIDSSPGFSKENDNWKRLLGPQGLADADWCRRFKQFDLKLKSEVFILLEEINKSEVVIFPTKNYLQTTLISNNNSKKPSENIDVDIMSINPPKKPKLFQISFNLDGNRKLNGEKLEFCPETPVAKEELDEADYELPVAEEDFDEAEYESSSSSNESLDNNGIPNQQPLGKTRVTWRRKLDFYPLHCTSKSFIFKNAVLDSLESTPLSVNKVCTPQKSPCVSETKHKSPYSETKTLSPCSPRVKKFALRESPVRKLDFSSLLPKALTPPKPTALIPNNQCDTFNNNLNVNNVETNCSNNDESKFWNNDEINFWNNDDTNFWNTDILENDLSNGPKQDVSDELNGEVSTKPHKPVFNITKTVFRDTDVSKIEIVNQQKRQEDEANSTSAQISPAKIVVHDTEIPKPQISNQQEKPKGETNAQILPPNDLANKLTHIRNETKSQASLQSSSTGRINPVNVEKTVYNDNVFKVPTFKVIKPYQVNKPLRRNIDVLKQFMHNSTKPPERVKDDDELSIYVSNDLIGDLDDLDSQRLSPIDEFSMAEVDLSIAEAERERNGLCDNYNRPTEQTSNDFNKSLGNNANLAVSNAPAQNFCNQNQPQFDESYHNGVEVNRQKFPTSSSSSSRGNQLALNRNNLGSVPSTLQIFRTLCKNANCRFGDKCRFSHNVPELFYTSLLLSKVDEVKEVYRQMNNFSFQNKNIYSILLFNIIQYYGHQKLYNDLMDLTSDIIKQRNDLIKTPFIQRIIDTLTNSLGVDYDDAVRDIAVHNRREVTIVDILLDIIVKKDEFLEKYWGIVKALTRGRMVSLDVGVLEDILKKCLIVQKGDLNIKKYLVCVCQDLLLQKFVNIFRIKEELLRTFANELYMLDRESSEKLDEIYFEFKRVHLLTNFSSSVAQGNKLKVPSNLSPPQKVTLTDEDIEHLTMAIVNGTDNVVIQLINKYKYQEYTNSFAAHFLLLYRRTKHGIYHNLLMNIYHKLENSFDDPDIKRTVECLIFNSLPYYDHRSDYKGGGEIIKLFMGDVISFVSSDSEKIISMKEFKSSLKTESQKFVFLIKLLSKGDNFKEAFELAQMKNCQFTDPFLFDYKMDKLIFFLNRAYETNSEIFTKLLFYFIKADEKVRNRLHLSRYYNLYLLKILERSEADKCLLVSEYNKHILQNLQLIEHANLRGILVRIFTIEDEVKNIAQIYAHCCRRGVYFQHNGSENTIKIKSNMTLQEMKVIVTMFFQNMLELKCPPKQIEIDVVSEAPPKKTSEILQKLLTFKCDRIAAMIRIACAFSCLVPSIDISDQATTGKLELTENDTKVCLERFKRKLEGN